MEERPGKIHSTEAFFSLFSAANRVYGALPELGGGVLSYPLPGPFAGSFLSPFHLNKTSLHKALSDLDCVFGPGVKISPLETMNPAPFTISYHYYT